MLNYLYIVQLIELDWIEFWKQEMQDVQMMVGYNAPRGLQEKKTNWYTYRSFKSG